MLRTGIWMAVNTKGSVGKISGVLLARRLMLWLPCLQCDLAPGPGDDRIDSSHRLLYLPCQRNGGRVGTCPSGSFSTCTHDDHTQQLVFCVISCSFDQHLLLPSHSLSSLHTNSLSSPPAVKIYWCPLMFSVPGFLPGNSYCWCFLDAGGDTGWPPY